MRVTTLSAPATEPIDYTTEARLQCKVDADASADIVSTINYLIKAARAYAEKQTGRSFVTRTLSTQYFSSDISNAALIPLPYGPVQSIVQVLDSNSNVISSALYSLETYGTDDYLNLKSGLRYPITVQYVAGYGDATQVPSDLKGAMLIDIDFNFIYREGIARENKSSSIKDTLDRIYANYQSGILVAG